MRKGKTVRKERISVAFLHETYGRQLKLERLNDVPSDERFITEKDLHRPGLALTGYMHLFVYSRVQLLGNTECSYLTDLPEEKRRASFGNLLFFDIPCIILTETNRLDEQLIAMATERGVPVFTTPMPTTSLMASLVDFLDDQFALQEVRHGALVDVYGMGILFVGRSGIGKSEIALDLVERGHRLVADDVVMITKKGERVLMGTGTNLVKHFMEVRGLGLIDIRAMFGIRAIRFQKRVEVVVELQDWDPNVEYTRTGLDDEMTEMMGVEVPLIKLPIFPGKNITVIAEVIALNHLLKYYGHDSAKHFSEQLAAAIARRSRDDGEAGHRAVQTFERDFE